ncbi:Alpha/Beta hydrolase protein [Microdochium trichocladiopsis]|uniref:Alpha/Beta hydrolase protein n=1 Tax=Microdochium trichocladiopsis TaxID=1682393 RepID=A0A9P8Y3P6_9PEZI|nr:Alpha/Beta hydrolase protein [Microdochium trichocladiopsis]KAH7028790.1 Alpha/Beta hydrolase protein [Microdochium trichocladiopsis]
MYDTRAEVEALAAKTDPDFEQLMASVANGGGPGNHPRAMMLVTPFEQIATFWQTMPQGPSLPDTPAQYTVRPTMRDGYESEARVYKSQSAAASSKTPLIVLIHGGGFCVGHWSHVGVHARALAHLYGATVCSVAYRLAPTHKFPTAPRDVWDALTWLTSEAGLAALGSDVDPASQGFVVGGVSAGANLAAVTAQKAGLLYADGSAEKLPFPITGCWLSLPSVYDQEVVPDKYRELFVSREQNARAPVINTAAIDYVRATYGFDAKSPEFTPGYGQGEDAPAKMPPTYLQVCGQDPLRDDGLIYDKVLRDNGVKTKLDVYPGVPHGFAELTDIPLAVKNRNDTLKGFSWLLGKEKEPTDEECFGAWKVADETATAPVEASG